MAYKQRLFTVAGRDIPDRSYENWFEMAFNLYKLLFTSPPDLAMQREIMENPRHYALSYYEMLSTCKRHF